MPTIHSEPRSREPDPAPSTAETLAFAAPHSAAHAATSAPLDLTTDLHGRRQLYEHLSAAMARAERGERLLGMLLVGLDRFRHVNDTIGHAQGDRLLRAAAGRLLSVCGDGAQVFRFSGDVFALAVEGVRHVDEIEGLARNVQRALAKPYDLEAGSLRIAASVGIAVSPWGPGHVDALVSGAEAALRNAKACGGDHYRFVEYSALRREQALAGLEAELAQAIESAQLQVFYQPQVDLASGRIIGAEALLRWPHAVYGDVEPARLVAAAERSGLIARLGRYVLERACVRFARWQREGLEQLRLSVNISPRQLHSPELLNAVREVLQDSGLAPERLHLELTETSAMQDLPASVELLGALRRLGVRTAMDDFGTGYSSLAHLGALPIDTLKIDRSFIRSLDTHGRHALMTRAILAMSQALGLEVVAEGVETPEQAELLLDWGCNAMQGHLVAPALPEKEFEAFVCRHDYAH